MPDGFDAIEYPLDYSFKAVCEFMVVDNDADIGEEIRSIEQKVQSTVAEIVGDSAVKNVASKISKAGNYISVTTTARLENRQQLEKTYHDLSVLEIVKMTL